LAFLKTLDRIDVNNFLSFQIHGGGDHGEGFSTYVAELLAFFEGLAGKEPSDMLASIFPGFTQLENIHPILVHFPIALITGFFLLDCLGVLFKKSPWRDVATGMLYLGALTAGFTVAAGLQAAESVAHGDAVHEIMENHEHIGIAILVLSVLLSLWRFVGRLSTGENPKGPVNGLFMTFSAILVVLVMFAADLGGLMVYQHGVAVKMNALDPVQSESHEHGHPHAVESGHSHQHSHSHSHDD
jgi:uncharacterized membrane protein